MEHALASIWRRIIVGEGKSWVVFSNGTCVIFTDAAGDLTKRALGIIRNWGPVHAGAAAGDFGVITLIEKPGWVVSCHHPDVLTYVSPGDLPSDPSEVQIGLVGRDRRHADSQELKIVHVEQGNAMPDPIRFYSTTTAYHELSNFSPFGFEDDRVFWPTVEHYFQAQKFAGAENAAYREKIRAAKTPKEAKALGRTRSIAIRPDWEEVKDSIMLDALRKKFAARELRLLLVGTGDRPLIEASPFDSYWGSGRSGKGRNRLGQLLMQVRAELRAARGP